MSGAVARAAPDAVRAVRLALEDQDRSAAPGAPPAPSAPLLLLARSPAFGDLLEAIVADEGAVAEIADRSYRHVLGFDKIIIVSLRPLGQLRLHVWWPSSGRPAEHPHNHRYNSHSVVLAGTLRKHAYAPGSGEAVERFREAAAPSAGQWQFTGVGGAFLSPTMVIDLPVGAAYAMSADTVHHIEASRALTATLFLEGRSIRDWSDVYVRAGDTAPAPGPQGRFTAPEVRERLLRLRTAVTGSP